jgi:hypothetical protein
MHSIPFTILYAQTGYLAFISSGQKIAALASLCIFSGSLIHLLLDEFHSIRFHYGIIPTFKRSSGTALKLGTNNYLITLLTYSLIITLTYVIMNS